LDGSVIGMDDSANRKVYGNNVKGEDILLGNAVKTNNVVQPFVAELQKVSPRHVHTKKVS
jgi:lipid-binding SYLF domain-containing protein